MMENLSFVLLVINLLCWLGSGLYGIAVAGPGKWDKAAFFIALSVWFFQGVHN